MGPAEEIFEKLKRDGESAIDRFIEIRQAESFYLDFKRSEDGGRGPKKLTEKDQNHFAKAISGFGNSEGGVLVWGVSASKDVDYADVAKAKIPIENVARFVGWLNETVSTRTVPPHTSVQSHGIDIGGNRGFVVTLIPKSERAPHQAIPEEKYYLRAGSSFRTVPHAVLAGMFGRRPQATLGEQYGIKAIKISEANGGRVSELEVSLEFRIYNQGPVTARELFSDIRVSVPDESRIYFANINEEWISRKVSPHWLSMVIRDEYRLAPESYSPIATVRLFLRPPYSGPNFRLKWTFGADGTPMTVIEAEHDGIELERIRRSFQTGPQDGREKCLLVRDLLKRRSQDQIEVVKGNDSRPANATVHSGRKVRFKFST